MMDNDLSQIIDIPTAVIGTFDPILVRKDLEVTSCKLGGGQMNSLSNNYSMLMKIKLQVVKSLYFRRGNRTAVFSYCNDDSNKFDALIEEKKFSRQC